MNKTSLTVFLCSTYSDLSAERAAVLEAVRRLQLQHDSMEFFGARDARPIETCLEEVRRSDVLVVIVGFKYGTLVPERAISFSEAEYSEGHELGKTCLVYIRDENVPILPAHMERDPAKIEALERFKAILNERHTVSVFQDANDLAIKVAADLGRTVQAIEKGQISRTQVDINKRINEIHLENWSFEPVFLYKQFEIKQDILSRDRLQLRNSIEAIALLDVDTHTHAARLLCDTGTEDGIAIKMEDFQFKLLKPAGNNADINLVENEHSSFRFSINFQQPILKDTPVKYAFERKHSNYFPHTREELEELLKAGKVKSRVMAQRRMIGQDFYVTQPTEIVRFVLGFPKGYPISRCAAAACYGKGELINKAETDRVEALVHLDHNEFDDQYTLTLDILNPHLHMTYLLLYEPPRADMLVKKG